MRIDIITVLPEMIEGFFNCSIMKRAQDKGLLPLSSLGQETRKTGLAPVFFYARAGIIIFRG